MPIIDVKATGNNIKNIIAAVNDVDDETIDDLRGMCVDEVAHINGVINFERAYDYQKGDDDDE